MFIAQHCLCSFHSSFLRVHPTATGLVLPKGNTPSGLDLFAFGRSDRAGDFPQDQRLTQSQTKHKLTCASKGVSMTDVLMNAEVVPRCLARTEQCTSHPLLFPANTIRFLGTYTIMALSDKEE